MTATVHSVRLGFSYSYVIEGDGGCVVVDTGPPRHERRILDRIRSLGAKDLRLIFITHAHLDHYGSAAALRRLTGAPIGIHRAVAGALARGETPLGHVRAWGRVIARLMPLFERRLKPEAAQADVLLEDGDRLDHYGVDATVLHTPGHTPGSSSLVVGERTAIVGDLASTRGRPHAQLFYASDWRALDESLRRLQLLGLERVYTGHGREPMSRVIFEKLRIKVT